MAATAVVLRDAIPDDADEIAAIWFLGWRDGHLGHVSDELAAVRTRESFEARAAKRILVTRVAVVGDEVAGFVMVVDDEVEQVYVSERHRGAGVADALMAAAEDQIRAAGHSVCWLAVVAGNGRARRFYERSGWLDAGLFDYDAAGPYQAIAVPSHRYEKRIR